MSHRFPILLISLLSIIAFIAACDETAPSKDTAPSEPPSAAAPVAPVAPPAAPAESPGEPAKTETKIAKGPMHKVILIAKTCKTETLTQKMSLINQQGGSLDMVYQNGALMAQAPEELIKEMKTWSDYYLLVDSTKGFEKFTLDPECANQIKAVVTSWGETMGKKPTAPAKKAQ